MREQLHFGLFDANHLLIATLIASPQCQSSTRLRQMAVSPSHARQGYGSLILQSAERQLFEQGIRHYFLHARETAIPFYRRHHYTEKGNSFLEIGIPHILMEKALDQSSCQKIRGQDYLLHARFSAANQNFPTQKSRSFRNGSWLNDFRH